MFSNDIPVIFQNARFGLLLFMLSAFKKTHNRAGCSSLFSMQTTQKSRRPKTSILKDHRYRCNVAGYSRIIAPILLTAFFSGSRAYATVHSAYYIQVLSSTSSSEADSALKRIEQINKSSGLVRETQHNGRTYYQVQLGPYQQLRQAKTAWQNLKGINHSGFIRSYPDKISEKGVALSSSPPPTNSVKDIALTTNSATSKPRSTLVVATLSAGPGWESGGETQTFYLAPYIRKSYVANKSTKGLATGEFFLGLQHSLPQNIQGQLGLAVATSSSVRLAGDIWDNANPLFNNYDYSYKIRHSHIAAKTKLSRDLGYTLIPWISGSLGLGFNHAFSFKNRPTIPEAVATANFSSHSTQALTYTLGTGLQHTLNQNWQIGIGYEFADWGKSQLGRTPGQSINSGLALNHLYTNSVLANISFIG